MDRMSVTTGDTQPGASNRTIDDRFGDSMSEIKPVFLPTTAGVWSDERCSGCGIQPDRTIAFKGTWNAATFKPEIFTGTGPISVDLSFKGTAIYVYFITGNQIAGGNITTLTECNFTLDGQHAGFFQHIPDRTTDMQYNVLGFNNTNLPNVDHTLRISTGDVDHHVLVMFDYAIYTVQDILLEPTSSRDPPDFGTFAPSPPGQLQSLTKNSSPIVAIIGVLAGITGILIFILSTILIRRHCRKSSARRRTSVTQERPAADQEPKVVREAIDSSSGLVTLPQHPATNYRSSMSDIQSRPNSPQSASRQSSIYSLSILLTSDDRRFSNPGNLNRVSLLSTMTMDSLQSVPTVTPPAQNTHDRGSLPMTSYTDSIYPVSTLPSYPGTVRSISPPSYSDLSRAQSRRILNKSPCEETYAESFPELPDLVHV